MAKRKNIVQDCDWMNPPATLDDHIFYGLTLDDEQIKFRDLIWSQDNDIVFCNSMAGTGKTLISLATAILMCKYNLYSGIVYIVSPTQEEKIGYLPGGVGDKIEPYTAPVIDALLKLNMDPFSAIKRSSLIDQKSNDGFIECISHVYLRGCNLENKVVIIDETQNTYFDELKKILTRISDGTTKTIVIGHTGQCDLYKNPHRSGFKPYLEHFKDQERSAYCELHTNQRGWIAQHADNLEF